MTATIPLEVKPLAAIPLPHILVIDDDARLRDLLRRYLDSNGFCVTSAKNAIEAREALESFVFDLAVLDVMMPGEDGVALTTSLRQTMKMPILLLTARGEVEDRIRGLESGADDYLVKPFEPRELILRISRILQRSRDPQTEKRSLVRLGDVVFERAQNRMRRGEDIIHLTQGEASLLNILADHLGQAMSREDLIAAGIAPGQGRTIDVQVTRLRRKIELDPRFPRYLQTVRGKGYVLHSG